MIEQIDPNHYLRQLEDIRDGDIICFQRWEGERMEGGEERGRRKGREEEGGKGGEGREEERVEERGEEKYGREASRGGLEEEGMGGGRDEV